METQAFAVVFAYDPQRNDYKSAKAIEDEIESGQLTSVYAVSGRSAGVCTRKSDKAVPVKEWFPEGAQAIEKVNLDRVHLVDESVEMADKTWCVKLIADVSYNIADVVTPPAD
ncbi:MAG: hypothetical protein HZB70_02635 [Candidatus Berkelbacteria bacterium]|nr:MAG: hypothetical protein HZB70_02635 [Candidatus Berkelbacteria bacterium]QQG51797.1 MAG: hypothetical protein HY845_00360 [Candidatus Berkelbacteria bacterium]